MVKETIVSVGSCVQTSVVCQRGGDQNDCVFFPKEGNANSASAHAAEIKRGRVSGRIMRR